MLNESFSLWVHIGAIARPIHKISTCFNTRNPLK
jgi:hypothetical protein